jgi:hypothetical protein
VDSAAPMIGQKTMSAVAALPREETETRVDVLLEERPPVAADSMVSAALSADYRRKWSAAVILRTNGTVGRNNIQGWGGRHNYSLRNRDKEK